MYIHDPNVLKLTQFDELIFQKMKKKYQLMPFYSDYYFVVFDVIRECIYATCNYVSDRAHVCVIMHVCLPYCSAVLPLIV